MAIGPKLDPKKWYYIIDIHIPISISFSIVFELLPRGNSNVQWFALENQQSPFYVVNEVTLTGQNPSLKFC